MNEERINEFLNSRKCVWLCGAIFVIGSLLAMHTGRFTTTDTGNGVFFSIGNNLIGNPLISYIVNMACTFAIVALSMSLNKKYGVVRSYTFISASMFLLLQTANPFLSTHFNSGTALCLIAVVLCFILYASYQLKNTAQRRIFLIFAVLSFCCMFQYVFLVLVVAFTIGFMQMRAMSTRGWLALILGIITPFWIAIGLGFVNPCAATPPQIEAIWDYLQNWQVQLVIGSTVIVALVAIVLMVFDMFTILNYRLQIRLYNSFLLVLTIASIAMMCVDYRNLLIYVPLLNWCLAIWIAHAFTIHNEHTRRYIFIAVAVVALLGTFVAHMLAT